MLIAEVSTAAHSNQLRGRCLRDVGTEGCPRGTPLRFHPRKGTPGQASYEQSRRDYRPMIACFSIARYPAYWSKSPILSPNGRYAALNRSEGPYLVEVDFSSGDAEIPEPAAFALPLPISPPNTDWESRVEVRLSPTMVGRWPSTSGAPRPRARARSKLRRRGAISSSGNGRHESDPGRTGPEPAAYEPELVQRRGVPTQRQLGLAQAGTGSPRTAQPSRAAPPLLRDAEAQA